MRIEKSFNEGWEFCLGECPKDYQPVQIPHDWAISAPFSRTMRQGAAQGFRDRWNCSGGGIRLGLKPVSLGQPHYGGLSSSSSEFSSAELSPPELDKAESFLLQPSSQTNGLRRWRT